MKKIISIILAMTLTTSILVGCEFEETTTRDVEKQKEISKDLEKKTINTNRYSIFIRKI